MLPKRSVKTKTKTCSVKCTQLVFLLIGSLILEVLTTKPLKLASCSSMASKKENTEKYPVSPEIQTRGLFKNWLWKKKKNNNK